MSERGAKSDERADWDATCLTEDVWQTCYMWTCYMLDYIKHVTCDVVMLHITCYTLDVTHDMLYMKYLIW